ncbi:MAG: Fic family protein [Alphaproteobacteria bacterium]|nr:Fic family protein [Alphaproteobacteria bacterium]
MNEPNSIRRHSVPLDADLIADANARAEAETRNGLRQYDQTIQYVESFIGPESRPFRLRPSIILDLHRTALQGISSYAGNYRPADVRIEKSRHQPPPASSVPALLEDMCEYVNAHFESRSAIHLAAYVLWRLNWIHPFADGNGRTSRAIFYLVLCVRLGERLPGNHTIPEQIVHDRVPYFEALEAADTADRNGAVDVSSMETLIEGMLAKQLLAMIERAKTH